MKDLMPSMAKVFYAILWYRQKVVLTTPFGQEGLDNAKYQPKSVL